MADHVVACRDLVKIYDSDRGSVHALRGIDMAVRAGSVTAVVGPSGSGKSSLLRILAVIDGASAGGVSIAGVPVEVLSARQRRLLRRAHIGFVGQRPSHNLQDGVPIGPQVRSAGAFRGQRKADVDGLFELLGLAGLASRRPHELSGGEQQRAALARALAGNPPLLLADEPTAELDQQSTGEICALIRRLADTTGLAALVATHDPEVMLAADHVVLLRDGAVQSETFAGEERSVIDGTGRLQLPPKVLAWFPGQRVRLEIDPETRTVRIWPT